VVREVVNEILVSWTENNKADAEMYLPYLLGRRKMQKVKFVTKEKDKTIAWCTTNRLIVFRDFMQYVLDTYDPHKFMIIDIEKNVVYDMYRIATEMYEMRKRTFTERMNNIQTGKWLKYSDEELKNM
jgi:hypothetical protein